MMALIDGDILIHRCGRAGEKGFYNVYVKGDEDNGVISTHQYKKEAIAWAEENVGKDDYVLERGVEYDSLVNVLHTVKETIHKINELAEAVMYKVFISGKGNFRYEIYPEYKANRDPDDKPKYYEEIKKYLCDHHAAEIVEGMEADDAMGIKQWTHPAPTIICTIDKDLNMIPGDHLNWVKEDKYYVDENEAMKFFYTQLLTGDTVDNVFGIKGIGPKTAAKMLAGNLSFDDMEEIVSKAYQKEYGDRWFDEITKNAKCLWIRREEGVSYDVKKKEVHI